MIFFFFCDMQLDSFIRSLYLVKAHYLMRKTECLFSHNDDFTALLLLNVNVVATLSNEEKCLKKNVLFETRTVHYIYSANWQGVCILNSSFDRIYSSATIKNISPIS